MLHRDGGAVRQPLPDPLVVEANRMTRTRGNECARGVDVPVQLRRRVNQAEGIDFRNSQRHRGDVASRETFRADGPEAEQNDASDGTHTCGPPFKQARAVGARTTAAVAVTTGRTLGVDEHVTAPVAMFRGRCARTEPAEDIRALPALAAAGALVVANWYEYLEAAVALQVSRGALNLSGVHTFGRIWIDERCALAKCARVVTAMTRTIHAQERTV